MKKDIKIIPCHEQGTSHAKISKILKVSRGTVEELITKKIETGDIKNRKKTGRPTKLTKSNCKSLKIKSLINRTKYCQE